MSALASLTANYSDSEDEAHSEDERTTLSSVIIDHSNVNSPIKSALSVSNHNSPDGEKNTRQCKRESDEQVSSACSSPFENDDEIYVPDKAHDSSQEIEPNLVQEKDEQNSNEKMDVQTPPLSPVSFHRSLIGKNTEDIQIPSSPQNSRCSQSLLDKVNHLHGLMREGRDMNAIIQKKKSFRNPSIYEKLIAYCNIDEFGTNFPPEVYQPHGWEEEDFYEVLAKRQHEEMDRREREKKERTKVEIIVGTKKVSSSVSSQIRKKTKWDIAGPSASNVGTLINPDVIKKKVEKAAATIQSFYKQ